MNIKFFLDCYLCGARSKDYDPTEPRPEGWRRTRRGFIGAVYICPECNKANKNYYRDMCDEAKK